MMIVPTKNENSLPTIVRPTEVTSSIRMQEHNTPIGEARKEMPFQDMDELKRSDEIPSLPQSTITPLCQATSFYQAEKMIVPTKNENNLPTIVRPAEVTNSIRMQEHNTSSGGTRKELPFQDMDELKRSDPFLYFSDDNRRMNYLRCDSVVQDTTTSSHSQYFIKRKTRISFEVHDSVVMEDLLEGLEGEPLDIIFDDHMSGIEGLFGLNRDNQNPAQ